MDLHCFVLRFPAELIYEEVIDWEERNKNGLMKEDCSGIFSINRSIKQHRTDKLPEKASNFRSTGSFVCVCVSRTRCGVGLSLPVVIGQRHLVYVHRANLGLRHRQQQH